MSIESEENLCHRAGCQTPSCCHDILISLSEQEIELFPTAVYDPRYAERVMRGKESLYYSENSLLRDGKGPYEGIIRGDCENLKTTPSGAKYCRVYPKRPLACQKIKRGSVSCNEARAFDGKPMVNPEFIEEITQTKQVKLPRG
ncbi:hypothetical protein A2125_00020 [Candidatus Woesebacteria bacterium GWB1_43_5]|uniref:YkgJ family cysteine cluster protein n=1 Tax=Candidatus Woesebacteria bacterium GWB1_43_5 TaxID=1802474 RepID=A0A1F7WT14_9BACT|nr:MAG: hypothetical protein A2125_00020 [Candidatus Woesebacteria bacterium GWB1_43_5]